jgi:hypothetical protein
MAAFNLFIVTYIVCICVIAFAATAVALFACGLTSIFVPFGAPTMGRNFCISPVWLDKLLVKVFWGVGFFTLLGFFIFAFAEIFSCF